MAENTARLELPLLHPGQAQKEMTHNEALALLDLAVAPRVLGRDAVDPPADPAPGDCWLLGGSPTGDWSGHAGAIAGWTEGGWRFLAPIEGLTLWIDDATGHAVFTGGSWSAGRARGRLFVDGVQVVGPRGAAIPAATGGTTVDAEARTALAAILAALQAHGLIG